MQLVRSLDILQPDFQWQYQLRHERDITAQVEAVRSLERYPTPGKFLFFSKFFIFEVLSKEESNYGVRNSQIQSSKNFTSFFQLTILL